MAKQRCRSLALERLEDRWVPATVHYDGSNLTITNLTGFSPAVGGVGGGPTLSVIQQPTGAFQVSLNGAIVQTPPPMLGHAGGVFTVSPGGANNGAYFVTGNLTINAGGGNVTVEVTLNNTSATNPQLPGNLSITTGNGNDTVILNTAPTGGRIGGNLSVAFGSGADFFESETGTANKGSSLSIGGNVSLSGKPGVANLAAIVAVGMEGFAAHNWIEFNQIAPISGQKTAIGGSVNVRGISEANIGAFSVSPNVTVGGDVNVQESAAPSPAFANPDADGLGVLYNNFVTLSVQTVIGGNANISGTAGSTFVLADSNTGGSINVNLAPSNGNNTLDLNLNVPPGSPGNPMTVGGNVNFYSGNGNNTLLFDSSNNASKSIGGTGIANPLLVGGSVNVYFGNGNNIYELNNVTNAGSDVSIAGNLSIHAGNGTNDIATVGPFASPSPLPQGTPVPLSINVQGNEAFYLGNGSNTVDLGNAPGGSVYFNGGNGSDKFTLENSALNTGLAQYYNSFTAVFGNGANTFTLGDAAGGNPVFASGSALGGNGTNIFTQFPDASPISVPFFLKNF